MTEPRKTEFEPNYAFPPGDTLAELLEDRGMTQIDLANRLGMSPKTINQIIKGKAAITPETAIKLENVLNVPARFWNAREQNYRETLARLKDKQRLKKQISWLEEIPMRALIKRGTLPDLKDKAQLVHHSLKFFGVASADQWREIWSNIPVSFRKSKKRESNLGSLAAWLRLGELQAQGMKCEQYDEQTFRENLRAIRALTVEPPKVFEPQLKRLCADSGVALVLVSELPQSRVSGAIRWMDPYKAIIQLSLRYKSDDHFWFTFFHEAGHVILHSSKELFLEGIDEAPNDKESEADSFAANFLIPPVDYRRLLSQGYFSKDAIKAFAREIGIAPGIVVGRLQHDKKLPMTHCNDLKRRFQLVSS